MRPLADWLAGGRLAAAAGSPFACCARCAACSSMPPEWKDWAGAGPEGEDPACYFCCAAEDQGLLVMELVGGGDLWRALRADAAREDGSERAWSWYHK